MEFYEQVSKYYDYIFPVKAPQLNFMTRTLGRDGKTVLDIACATGGYAAVLSQMGFDVTAFDLDETMVEMCRERMEKEGLNAHVFQGDMLHVGEVDGSFDLAFCIGNSMVHLDNLEEVRTFLKGCHKVLEPQGRLVIQILNYDRVLDENVSSLPTIFNSDVPLSFERIYEYSEDTGKITFIGRLEVEGEKHESAVTLLPLRSTQLMELMEECGFGEVEIFADFMKKPFDPKISFHAVLRGRKVQ